MIFTIGLDHLTIAELELVMSQCAIDLVIDGRSNNRIPRATSGPAVAAALGAAAPYIWNPQLSALDVSHDWLLRELAALSETQRVLLLFRRHAPGDCNRHDRIAVPLLALGVDSFHIFEDELILASELRDAITLMRPYHCFTLGGGFPS